MQLQIMTANNRNTDGDDISSINDEILNLETFINNVEFEAGRVCCAVGPGTYTEEEVIEIRKVNHELRVEAFKKANEATRDAKVKLAILRAYRTFMEKSRQNSGNDALSSINDEVSNLETFIKEVEFGASRVCCAVGPGTYTEEEVIEIRKMNQELRIEALMKANEATRDAKAKLAILRASQAAAILGKKGGSVKSPKKTISSRENARKPRPRGEKIKLTDNEILFLLS